MMMGERTQANPKRQTNQTNQTTPTKQHQKATGRFPIIQTVFPLYGGETGEKSWLHTIYGPEFATKVCQKGQCTSEEQAKPIKGASFHHQNCDHTATASSGKTWHLAFRQGLM